MDLPEVIYLHKVQSVLKISLILSKGVPIRTIPKVCIFRCHKFSNHNQAPGLPRQNKLFSLKDGEAKGIKLHFSKLYLKRGACTSLIRHEEKVNPLQRPKSLVHFQLEVGQHCPIWLVMDWL